MISPSKQSGVGLVEVLVTILIVSVSLLTLAALQARSLHYNHSAYLRSQANILAYDILDRMRANDPDISDAINPNLTSYNVQAAEFDLNTPPVTSPLVAADLYQWRRAIARSLPKGKGSIECEAATGICLITIAWDELNGSDISDEDSTTFTYRARL